MGPILNWLDKKLFGIRSILVNGVEMPERPTLALTGAVGASDNPGANRTDLTFSGGGGGGGDLTPTTIKTSDYVAGFGELVLVDASANDITIRAPDGALQHAGARWGVLRVEPSGSSTHVVTLDGDDAFDDEGTYTLRTPRSCTLLRATSRGWRIDSEARPFSVPSDALPSGVGTAGAAGTSPALARADHAHALGYAAVQVAIANASSPLMLGGQRITAVADPVGGQDAATRAYVDAHASAAGVLHSGTGQPNSTRVVQGRSSAGVAVTSPAPVTAGDLLVVLLQCEADITGATVSDTLGTTYTKVREITSHPLTAQVWAGVAPTSGACTITGTQNANWARTTFAEYAGATATIEGSDAVYGGVGPLTVVAGEPGALIVGAVASYHSSVGYTPASGFEVDATATDADSSLLEHHVATAAGAVAVTYGTSAPDDAPFFAVAIAPSAVSSVGVDGDWYLDLTSKILYGPRTNGVYQRVGALS
jgi:hypothetical protein